MDSNTIYKAFAPYYRHFSEKKSNYIVKVDDLILTNLPTECKTILDVGCGDGVRGKRLFERIRGSEILMIDSCPEMSNLAKKFELKPKISVVALDIAEPESLGGIPKGHFDIVLCLWNVLGHITDPHKRCSAIRNMADSLRPGGRILMDVSNRYNVAYYGLKIVAGNIIRDIVSPNPNNGTIFYKIRVTDNKEIDSYCHFFTPDEIPKLLSSLNLKIIKIIYVNYKTGKLARPWSGHIFYVAEKA